MLYFHVTVTSKAACLLHWPMVLLQYFADQQVCDKVMMIAHLIISYVTV